MAKSNKCKAYLDQGISTRYSKRTSKKGMNTFKTTKPTGLTLKLKQSLRCTPKNNLEKDPMPKSLTPNPSTRVKTDLDLHNDCDMKGLPYDECSLHYPSADEFNIDHYLHHIGKSD